MQRTAAPASGIVSAVLIVVGIILLIWEEVDTRTDQHLLEYYADSGNRTSEIVGFVLVVIGALLFLWFLATLRSRLAWAGSEGESLPWLAFGAGTAAATLLVGGAGLLVAHSFAVEFADQFEIDPNLARIGLTSGFLFLLGWVLVNLVLIAATSVLALRTDVLPRWLGWVGFAATVLAVIESFLFPVFVIPLWVVTVSVSMLRSERRDAASPSA